jgi:hypothetical protein
MFGLPFDPEDELYVLPKHRSTLARIHSVTFHKTVTAVRASNLTRPELMLTALPENRLGLQSDEK